MNREVTMELLEKYGKEFVQDRANRVAQNAVVGKGVNASATDSGVEREIANTFSISLEQGKITNQKKERPLLDVRSLKLHAFSGNEALQSGNF